MADVTQATCKKCGHVGKVASYVEAEKDNWRAGKPGHLVCEEDHPKGEHLHVQCPGCHCSYWQHCEDHGDKSSSSSKYWQHREHREDHGGVRLPSHKVEARAKLARLSRPTTIVIRPPPEHRYFAGGGCDFP